MEADRSSWNCEGDKRWQLMDPVPVNDGARRQCVGTEGVDNDGPRGDASHLAERGDGGCWRQVHEHRVTERHIQTGGRDG